MENNKKKYIIYTKSDTLNTSAEYPKPRSALQCAFCIGERRRMTRIINTSHNRAFCRRHGIDPVYSSRYCRFVIAMLNEKEVEKIKSDEEVTSVYEFDSGCQIPMQTDIISRQIRTDSISGSHSENFGGRSNGYLGNYITVGAVSAQNLTYIPEALQLRAPLKDGRLITLYDPNTPIVESEHSSVVASIIVGDEVRRDGVIYRGASPMSRLYVAPSSGVEEMLEAMEKCIDNGAVIINYSAGEYFSDGKYDEFDRAVDTLICNTGILFVVSAGNSEYVSSPGTCFNGVTVGNAATKINGYEEAQMPYEMFFVSKDDCSAYVLDDALPSKPDVAAPGTYIHYFDDRGRLSFSRYGTSFSAPYVTSVAAQLAEKYPDAIPNPMILKALILCGANGNAVSKRENPRRGDNDALRLKSGAGFLDSAESLGISDMYGGRISDGDKIEKKVLLRAGEVIRAVVCYFADPGKIGANGANENIVLELYSPDGTVKAVSDDKRENVKLIEYTAESMGVYTLSVEAYGNGKNALTYGIAWRTY